MPAGMPPRPSHILTISSIFMRPHVLPDLLLLDLVEVVGGLPLHPLLRQRVDEVTAKPRCGVGLPDRITLYPGGQRSADRSTWCQ